eukprot:5943271-Prymnesium_polylepis.1
MLQCVVSYLAGTVSAYTQGRVAESLLSQARYMEGIKERGAWARFWANMGGVEYDVAPLIYDSAKYLATGLENHHRWAGEWYGVDVPVQYALSLIATKATPNPRVRPKAMGR